MEDNNGIFPAGGDTLIYLIGPLDKNLQHLLGVILLVCTYLTTDFSTRSPLYAYVHI